MNEGTSMNIRKPLADFLIDLYEITMLNVYWWLSKERFYRKIDEIEQQQREETLETLIMQTFPDELKRLQELYIKSLKGKNRKAVANKAKKTFAERAKI